MSTDLERDGECVRDTQKHGDRHRETCTSIRASPLKSANLGDARGSRGSAPCRYCFAALRARQRPLSGNHSEERLLRFV